jgi:hypothetical protein
LSILCCSVKKVEIPVMEKTTTNMEHFRKWEVKHTNKGFGECPAIVPDLIFPTMQRSFETSTNSAYKLYQFKEKSKAFNQDMLESLKNEGSI